MESRQPFSPLISVRLRLNDRKVFGPGIAVLLERIDKSASLRTAAAGMRLAYSKAWSMLRASEQALGYPLITRKVGGEGGGGSVLTPEGRELLLRFRKWEADCNLCAGELLDRVFREGSA